MNPTTEDIRTALNTLISDKIVMTWWQLLIVVLASGVAAYIGAYLKKRGENLATKNDIDTLTRGVESIKSEYSKEIETYKDGLLRRKIIFEEQLEAYNKLRRLFYIILPEKSHPEEEWDEALGEIANGFQRHGKEIKDYLIEYSGVLPELVRKNIESCYHACNNGKFHSTVFGGDFTAQKQASDLWNKLVEAESDFTKHLEIKK